MRRMTWNELHDFVLVGAALFVVGLLSPYATFYIIGAPPGPRSRLRLGLSFAVFLIAVWIVAFWFTR
jgi:hypothetical protein